MFNLKKSKYPNFRILNTFYKKDFYFLRNTEWSRLDDNSILVTDPKKLEILTLTDWPQIVFRLAEGVMTIEESVYFIADQYPDKIPEMLDETVILEILALEKKKIIVLSNHQQKLPVEYDLPGLEG
jgi:hypothetical protein